MLIGCGRGVLSVNDAVMLDDEKVRLTAYVERERGPILRGDVEDIDVAFLVDDVLIDKDNTDDDGRASVKVKARKLAGHTHFEARATLPSGRKIRSRGRIFVWEKGRTIVAVDIDGTISETEYGDLVFEEEDNESEAVKRSQRALAVLADDFHIVYVTARPRSLMKKTRTWLAAEGFPSGPVVMAARLRDTIRQAHFKRRLLKDLRDDWPNLLIGIGDRQTDSEAYGATGMLTIIVDLDPENLYGRHAVVLSDWKMLDRFFAANRDVLENPKALRDALKGKTMLRRPVLRWEDD
jgi:hypothetical protein